MLLRRKKDFTGLKTSYAASAGKKDSARIFSPPQTQMNLPAADGNGKCSKYVISHIRRERERGGAISDCVQTFTFTRGPDTWRTTYVVVVMRVKGEEGGSEVKEGRGK